MLGHSFQSAHKSAKLSWGLSFLICNMEVLVHTSWSCAG